MLQENKLECVTPEQKAGVGLSCCVLYDLSVLAGIPNVPLCVSAQACHGSERKEADGASNTGRSWAVMTLHCCHCLYRKPSSLGRRRKGFVSTEKTTITEGGKKKSSISKVNKICETKGKLDLWQWLLLNFWIFHSCKSCNVCRMCHTHRAEGCDVPIFSLNVTNICDTR